MLTSQSGQAMGVKNGLYSSTVSARACNCWSDLLYSVCWVSKYSLMSEYFAQKLFTIITNKHAGFYFLCNVMQNP